MYLHITKDPRAKKRGKTARHKAKAAAKNRRRVNGMRKRKLGRRFKHNG